MGRARTSSMHGKEQKDLTSAVSARSVSHTLGVDRVRALQRVLYRCAKQDRDRRFHALYDKVARSDVMRRATVGCSRIPTHTRGTQRQCSRRPLAGWLCGSASTCPAFSYISSYAP